MKMLLLEANIDDERQTVIIRTREVKMSDSNSAEKLKEYYRLLDCRYIDICEVEINGKYFDLIVDDEGMLPERPIPTFYVEKDKAVLYGNILFAHCNEDGEIIGLEDSELPMLANYVGENLKKLQNFLASVCEKQNR